MSAELGRCQAGGEDLARQLGGLQAKVERANAYGGSVDNLVGAMLVESLAPDQRCLKRPAGEHSRAICTEDLADWRPPSWAKIRLLRSLLEQYEWVLWLDADVVIVDVDADIGREIEDTKDAYLVEHAYMGR